MGHMLLGLVCREGQLVGTHVTPAPFSFLFQTVQLETCPPRGPPKCFRRRLPARGLRRRADDPAGLNWA